ncbi:MAG: DUF4349 domain-containing protein [Bacteroidetes bacterium]|nr:DUF4349 domain-containing protein [Bacteroidota bacterium]
MSKLNPFYGGVLLLLLFSACNQNKPGVDDDPISSLNRKQDQVELKTDSQQTFQPPSATLPPQKRADTANINTSPKTTAYIDWDKKIIKTANVKLEVKDFKAYNDKLHQTLKQYGAYVAQEEQNTSEEHTEDIVTIKVPVEQFDNLMNQVTESGEKVKEKKITTEDVTAEIFDTKSRLETRKQIRQKYLDFAKAARNTDEVIKAEDELNNIQEQIESAAGRIQFLNHQSVYSTINLTFFQLVEGYKPADDNPSFFSRLSAAFSTGGSWLGSVLIALIAVWPLWISVIAGVWILKRILPARKTVANK